MVKMQSWCANGVSSIVQSVEGSLEHPVTEGLAASSRRTDRKSLV